MVQLTPIRGFTNTPVSKSICIISTILPLVLSILSIKYYLNLGIDPYIIEYYQFWRLITYQLSVINESDYLLVILLWFQFKVLERFYGSRKYLSVITSFAISNSIVCLLVMSLGQLLVYYVMFIVKVVLLGYDAGSVQYQTTILNTIIPGPLGIISSLYVTYGANIPVSYYFKIVLKKPSSGGNDVKSIGPFSQQLNLTNRFPVHILFTLLFFNNGFKSIIPCSVGLLIGKLYTFELLPMGTSWLLPRGFFHMFINPRKKVEHIWQYLQQRFTHDYQPLSVSNTNEELQDRNVSEEPEDNDELLDETRQEESRIRAETPVRPLGSQFLDTFRS
ncbi:hypothetical protein CORT_0C04750 [Candida orthopsilosis Co 90-125]|uniref:Uncharacterized protein n=1 Tax=Candida orthopsilosis (strain 90-125) TaxID=1136231 RepID=H8X2Y9_CANO9|nr:hypothetical protein CORT_0C04750 [Candida orthopsilosis Co 90-125]CCG25849.1 hypothetical protein CORT_0C04750 [Candida orthopsilosis Co 90-125]